MAFVRHGSNLTLYVDGKYIASDARVSTSVAHLGGEAAVRMGARGHSNIYDRAPWTPYKGELDDVRLYTRTLNDSEVQLMYERSRDPWTYKLITFQLTNGTYILVELSPDGVDPQCMGTNGVCITGSSPSNLIAAAGSFTGSLADRMRCGSELQNVTGESGYDSGASHWCAQAAVYLKGTTTTRTTSTRSTATTTETHTSSSTTHTSTSLSKTTTSWTHSTTIIPSTTTTLPPQSFSEANFTSIQLLDGTWIFAKLSPNGDPQCIPSGSTCLSAPDNTTLWNNAGSITSSDVGNSIVCGSALKTSSGTTGYQDGHWCWEAAALLNSPVVQNDNFCADPLLGTTGLKHRWVYHPARQTYVDCIGGLHPIIVEAVSGGSNVTYTDIVGSVPLRKAMTTDGLGAGYEVDESMLAIGYSDFTLSFWMLPDATVPDKQLLFTDRIGNTASGENFTFLLIHPAEERVSMEILSGSLSEYQIVEVRNYSSGYHTSPNLFNSTWCVTLLT